MVLLELELNYAHLVVLPMIQVRNQIRDRFRRETGKLHSEN